MKVLSLMTYLFIILSAVKNDNNFVSNYSKRAIKNDDYSEDFAESIAFFLIIETKRSIVNLILIE